MNNTFNLQMFQLPLHVWEGDNLINISDFNMNSIFDIYNFYNLINIDIDFIFVSVIVVTSLGSFIFLIRDNIFKRFIEFIKFKNIITNINDKKGFGLVMILKYLDVQIPGEEAEPILNLAFVMFSFSLLGLFSFISIIGYLLTILVLNNKNLEEKINSRPRIKKMVEFYKKTTLLYIGIDIIFCLLIFLFFIFYGLFILGIILK